MRLSIFLAFFCSFFIACTQKPKDQSAIAPVSFNDFFENYYQEWLSFYPLQATQQGVAGYNDQLQIEASDDFRQRLRDYYTRTKATLTQYDPTRMDPNERIGYDILRWEYDINLEALQFPDNYMPINQFWSFRSPWVSMGRAAARNRSKRCRTMIIGLKRVAVFPAWVMAMVYMRKGLAGGHVLPQALVDKIFPQFKELVTGDPTKSLYDGPIQQLPDRFPAVEKARLTDAYSQMIRTQLVPAFRKLAEFFEQEYLPRPQYIGYRSCPGWPRAVCLPGRYLDDNRDECRFNFRIGPTRSGAHSRRNGKGKNASWIQGRFAGNSDDVRTDRQFRPFKKPEEVIGWYAGLETTNAAPTEQDVRPGAERPVSKCAARKRFAKPRPVPNTYRARPMAAGRVFFHVPVPDATKHNVVGGEALFLHEAIPGDTTIKSRCNRKTPPCPVFAASCGTAPMVQGWALYTESLGPELGLYTDPYQYFGMLSSEMHRAIRLVVDVGLHTKGWTREQAIEYSKKTKPSPKKASWPKSNATWPSRLGVVVQNRAVEICRGAGRNSNWDRNSTSGRSTTRCWTRGACRSGCWKKR